MLCKAKMIAVALSLVGPLCVLWCLDYVGGKAGTLMDAIRRRVDRKFRQWGLDARRKSKKERGTDD